MTVKNGGGEGARASKMSLKGGKRGKGPRVRSLIGGSFRPLSQNGSLPYAPCGAPSGEQTGLSSVGHFLALEHAYSSSLHIEAARELQHILNSDHPHSKPSSQTRRAIDEPRNLALLDCLAQRCSAPRPLPYAFATLTLRVHLLLSFLSLTSLAQSSQPSSRPHNSRQFSPTVPSSHHSLASSYCSASLPRPLPSRATPHR